MPIPCNDEDRRLFATTTTITRGDGMTTRFWESSWLQCDSPKQIAPTIYNLSKKGPFKMLYATTLGFGTSMSCDCLSSVTHLQQFIQLWVHLRNVQLAPGRPDSIIWNLTKHGRDTTSSAYNAQLTSFTNLTPMEKLIWRVWAPPKCKLFPWLAFPSRLWTADRLITRAEVGQTRKSACSAVHMMSPLFTSSPNAATAWRSGRTSSLGPRHMLRLIPIGRPSSGSTSDTLT
jgi:hypothetical protein